MTEDLAELRLALRDCGRTLVAVARQEWRQVLAIAVTVDAVVVCAHWAGMLR